MGFQPERGGTADWAGSLKSVYSPPPPFTPSSHHPTTHHLRAPVLATPNPARISREWRLATGERRPARLHKRALGACFSSVPAWMEPTEAQIGSVSVPDVVLTAAAAADAASSRVSSPQVRCRPDLSTDPQQGKGCRGWRVCVEGGKYGMWKGAGTRSAERRKAAKGKCVIKTRVSHQEFRAWSRARKKTKQRGGPLSVFCL